MVPVSNKQIHRDNKETTNKCNRRHFIQLLYCCDNIKKRWMCFLLSLSIISSSDILPFFFCLSVALEAASPSGHVLGAGMGSMTERVYICTTQQNNNQQRMYKRVNFTMISEHYHHDVNLRQVTYTLGVFWSWCHNRRRSFIVVVVIDVFDVRRWGFSAFSDGLIQNDTNVVPCVRWNFVGKNKTVCAF